VGEEPTHGGDGVARGLLVGEKAPDFALTAGSGETVRLSESLQRGPVVLVWYHLAFTGG
jgi:peroxiredoxin